jgi:hypothetical protein
MVAANNLIGWSNAVWGWSAEDNDRIHERRRIIAEYLDIEDIH